MNLSNDKIRKLDGLTKANHGILMSNSDKFLTGLTVGGLGIASGALMAIKIDPALLTNGLGSQAMTAGVTGLGIMMGGALVETVSILGSGITESLKNIYDDLTKDKQEIRLESFRDKQNNMNIECDEHRLT